MTKKGSKPTSFFELIIDPSIFKGSKPDKNRKFAEVVHEVAAIDEKVVHKIIYYDPYMASSLAQSKKFLAVIEEIRLKFNSPNFILFGCITKGSFECVDLSAPYVGIDYLESNIHDRFMLFFDVNHELITGVSIGCSINAVIGKDHYGINKLPDIDSETWFLKIKDLLKDGVSSEQR